MTTRRKMTKNAEAKGVYVGLNVYVIIIQYLSQVVQFRQMPQYPVESFRDCLCKWTQIGRGHSAYYLHGFHKRL